MAICNGCANMMYTQAFTEGKCNICGKEFTSACGPAEAVCPVCAKEHNLCQQCGLPFHEKKYPAKPKKNEDNKWNIEVTRDNESLLLGETLDKETTLFRFITCNTEEEAKEYINNKKGLFLQE